MGMASAPRNALDELVAAAKPVSDAVAADPVAGPVLTKVTALVGEADPDFTSICYADQLIDPSSLTPDGGSFPNGVYRFTVTAQTIKDAGLPDSECPNNCGTYTWTLKDGHYSWTIDWPVYPPADIKTGECCWTAQQGIYQVKGNLISLEWPWLWNAEKSFVLETRWRINDDKSIALEYQRGSLKWERWLKAGITMPPGSASATPDDVNTEGGDRESAVASLRRVGEAKPQFGAATFGRADE
jgi:hypothetical protein